MPTFTSPLRPASERQVAYITALMRDRTAESIGDRLANEVDDALNGRPVRRDLIDRLAGTPRLPRGSAGGVAQPAHDDGAIDVPAPSRESRAGRMLSAGSIEATATLADGRHVTVVIRTRTRSGRGWTNAALGEDGSRTSISILGTRVGWVGMFGGQLRLTLRTRNVHFVAAIEAVFDYAASRSTGGIRVQEASRCGRCFRQLTDPVSIDRGIGPECFGRDTGSQHVASTEAVAEQQARRAEQRGRRLHDSLASAGTSAALVAAEARRQNDLISRRSALVAPGVSPVTEQQAADFAEAAMNRAERAAASEAAESRRQAHLDAVAASTRTGAAVALPTDLQRARDLIAEALDAYHGDPDATFAIRIFDQLAAR